MSTTSIASTILTVGGTPTEFLPLPTPWPSGDGCASNVYLHTPVSNPNTFLAWDPLYGARMVSSAQSCLPPQVTSWWDQAASANPYIALGPTFVCPQAYSAVQTVLVASAMEQIFCCPSQYSLLVPQPNRASVFPSQCISTVSSGQTMTYLSQQGQPDAFTATVVITSTATVFGIPVNGFNFATAGSISSSQSTSSTVTSSTPPTSTSTGSASQPTSSSAPSTSPSLGETVGISIGVVFGALLVAFVAFVGWRRKRGIARSIASGPALLPEYQRQPGGLPNSMNIKHELFAGGQLLSPRELPSNQVSKVYELSDR